MEGRSEERKKEMKKERSERKFRGCRKYKRRGCRRRMSGGGFRKQIDTDSSGGKRKLREKRSGQFSSSILFFLDPRD